MRPKLPPTISIPVPRIVVKEESAVKVSVCAPKVNIMVPLVISCIALTTVLHADSAMDRRANVNVTLVGQATTV